MPLTTYTAGQVLTASSLNANLVFAAQSGGLVSVAPTSVGKTGASSTATASTNGQVTFGLCETLTLNGVFTSTYANYRIVFAGFASTNILLFGRLSVAGTANSTANYNRQYLVASNTTISAARVTGGTSWNIVENLETIEGDNFALEVFNPQAAKNTSYTANGGSTRIGSYWQSEIGYFNAATQFDGISFITSAGTFSGTISVYGYNQ